jgi:2-polyprenyl-3-methyl-5-hydroxy-6-metoxy-1,4-benzoquinol methylase
MKKGEYFYIPLSMDTFLSQLDFAITILDSRPGAASSVNPKFIDVGCGIGTKLVTAAQRGFDVYGVELDPRYVKIATRLLKVTSDEGYIRRFDYKVFQSNAMRHDYSNYDVIYFYCPFSDHVKEKKLEERIVTQAKPGTIILANLRKATELWTNGKLVRHLSRRYNCDMAFEKL